MIINLTFFLFGAACLAFCLRRQVEQKRAFDAACGQIETLELQIKAANEREKAYQEVFARVQARTRDLRKKLTLGDEALPPAVAESNGRRLFVCLETQTKEQAFMGPSRSQVRRSRLFRRSS